MRLFKVFYKTKEIGKIVSFDLGKARYRAVREFGYDLGYGPDYVKDIWVEECIDE